MSQFHLLRPEWLLAIIPIVLITFFLLKQKNTNNNWNNVCDKHLLPHLLVGENKSNNLNIWLLTAAMIIAAIALSGPSFSKQELPVYRSTSARVVLFDLSPSMLAEDIKPSRLVRAKYKLRDLLKQLHEGQTGLIAFSGEPFVVSPLTQDTNTIAAMVPELSPYIMPVGGSNISLALKEAKKLFINAGVDEGHIILITDSTPNSAAITEAETLASQGFDLSVMGIGTKQGAPIPLTRGGFLKNNQGEIEMPQLNQAALQQLAEAGKGIYVGFANTNQDIKQLIKATSPDHLTAKAQKTQQKSEKWQDQGWWLLFLLLPFSLYSFRRGLY